MGQHTTPPVDLRLVQIYLSDHLTGASGVISRVGWMVERYAGTSAEPVLLRLLEELRQERRVVRGLAEHLGLRLSPWKPVAAVAAERAGRLKVNGRLTSKSPLSLHLELEALRSGISGKRSLWATLEVWSGTLRLETYIGDAERAGDQELADFFRRAQGESRKGAEQGKRLLKARLGA